MISLSSDSHRTHLCVDNSINSCSVSLGRNCLYSSASRAVNHRHHMSQVTRTCAWCKDLDLPHMILRSGLTESHMERFRFGRVMIFGCSGSPFSGFPYVKEGSCSRCNLLTRALGTTFGDMDTGSLPGPFGIYIESVPHPVLPDHEATYFAFGPSSRNEVPRRYLLPTHARFVNLRLEEATYLPCARVPSSESIDYNKLNDAIGMCLSKHSEMCGSSSHREFTPTRLIDCKTRVLCTAPDSQYICLSYVWGDVPAGNATSNNTALAKIPQTVLDAISVTLKLGMRYLWVDRYCIDQNNPGEKHEAIRNMDSIYRNALVTIIAAAGSGSDYGLPGVSRPRKSTPHFGIGSHDFVVVKNPREDVEFSVWNTRGWTYQEMLLSRRRLIFTDHQVCFQCRKGLATEQLDQSFASTNLMTRISMGKEILPTQNESFAIHDIYSRLEEYYPRSLRYETDNINAFAGVFRELSGRTSEADNYVLLHTPGLYMSRTQSHFYGIPIWLQEPAVDYAEGNSIWWRPPKVSDEDKNSLRFGLDLGWKLVGERRDSQSTQTGARRKSDFPSWSWASVKSSNPEDGKAQIIFPGRPNVLMEISDADFRVNVMHRTGERMSMLEFTAQADDYALFNPWIDVSAYTLRGHIRMQEMEGSRLWTFSGLFDAEVHLDTTQIQETGHSVAIYIGMFRKDTQQGGYDAALFLLLEETEQHEFRRVGCCEVANGQVNNDDDSDWYFGVNGGFLPCHAEEQIPQEELESRVKWTREELRII